MRHPRNLPLPHSALLVAIVTLGACYGPSGPIAPEPFLTTEHPSKVRVVAASGAARTVFMPQIQADSLVGHAGDSTLVPARRPNTRIAIPLSEVRYVTVDRFKPGRTFLLILATPVVLISVVCLAGGCQVNPAL